jgi:hypothetical protein
LACAAKGFDNSLDVEARRSGSTIAKRRRRVSASALAACSATERHEAVKDLFHQAVLLPPSERPGFLLRTTAGDGSLLAELESLLSHFGPQEAESARHPGDAALRETARPALACGALLSGRYRIERLIGRGGMSEVYAAHDELLEDGVALKVLASAGRGQRTRMQEEVRLARRISHPAVCRVHDLGEHDGELFLTMELVDGASLASGRGSIRSRSRVWPRRSARAWPPLTA